MGNITRQYLIMLRLRFWWCMKHHDTEKNANLP